MESISKKHKIICDTEIDTILKEMEMEMNKLENIVANLDQKYRHREEIKPKCCWCNSPYCSLSKVFDTTMWKCFYCGTINRAQNGYAYTYFKDFMSAVL
jgi:hypothetical protein